MSFDSDLSSEGVEEKKRSRKFAARISRIFFVCCSSLPRQVPATELINNGPGCAESFSRDATSTQQSKLAGHDHEQASTFHPGRNYVYPAKNNITFNLTMSQLFGQAAAATATTNTVGDLKQDVELSSPPEDSITDLAFSPAQQADYLAVSSWDKKVRIYEINSNGQSAGKHMYEHDGPVFSCDFSKVSLQQTRCGFMFSGGCAPRPPVLASLASQPNGC